MDKTDFIRQWWTLGDEVTLICRPCRFGKTLTPSMCDTFLSQCNADREELFGGLVVDTHSYLRQSSKKPSKTMPSSHAYPTF